MIHKFKARCRKITHRTQANIMTLIEESKKYFSEGFVRGRYGRYAGAWHMSHEDTMARSYALLEAIEEVALFRRYDDTEAAKYVMMHVCEVGWRRGIEQYAREELKNVPPEEKCKLIGKAEVEREHLIDEAFEKYWNDTTGDKVQEE